MTTSRSSPQRPLRVLCAALASLGIAAVPACGDGADDGARTAARAAFPDASLVVVSIDTLRADALALYGGPAGISPVLDELARQSIVFDRARSHSPHTAPSHMTLFTSVYPSVHGVQNMSAGGDDAVSAFRLADQLPTLAEVLAGAGFTTRALADGGQLQRLLGFERGFHVFATRSEGVAAKVERGARWIEQLAAEQRRFFLFWHTYEVHAPYIPPPALAARWTPADYDGPARAVVDELAPLSFGERMARVRAFWDRVEDLGPDGVRFLRGLYHGGVAYTDAELAGLLDALRRTGLLDRVVLVVLSDHGEEFLEHGKLQHKQLYEECLRVPLMIRLPGAVGAGRRVATPVGLIDVMPTVLELLGVDAAAVPGLAMQGRSLAGALLAGTEPPERPVTSEHRWNEPGRPVSEWADDWAVAHHFRGWKFLHDGVPRDGGADVVEELYDLSADPGETRNLIAEQPEAAAERFREIHARWRAEVDARAPGAELRTSVDAATREQLIQLGYAEGDGGR